MSRSVVKSDSALDDLASIWNYIAHGVPASGDPHSASRVIEATDRTFQNLADFPHRHQIPGRSLFRCGVEGFPQYVIIFEYDDAIVRILRVFRGDLDWERVIQDL